MRQLIIVLTLAIATRAGGADTVRTEAAGLRFAVPGRWQRVPAPSDVRAAQFRIPGASPGGNDGELVLYYFGPGRGGGAEDNLARWYGQFTQADGRASRDAAVVTIRTVNGLRITAVDLGGSYRGMGAAEAKPGYRLLGAIVEGPGGPWFWKGVGPEGTMAAAKGAFDELLLSLEPHR